MAKPSLVYSVCGVPPNRKDPLEYAIVGQEYDPKKGFTWRCYRCKQDNCTDIQAVQQFRRQAGITE